MGKEKEYINYQDKKGKKLYVGDIIWAGRYSSETGKKLLARIIKLKKAVVGRDSHSWEITTYSLKMLGESEIFDFDQYLGKKTWEKQTTTKERERK